MASADIVSVVVRFFFVLPMVWIFSLCQALLHALHILPTKATPSLADKVVADEDRRSLNQELAYDANDHDEDDAARVLSILNHMKRSMSDENLLDHLDEATALLRTNVKPTVTTPRRRKKKKKESSSSSASTSSARSKSAPTVDIPGPASSSESAPPSSTPPNATPTYRPAPLFVSLPQNPASSSSSNPAGSPTLDSSGPQSGRGSTVDINDATAYVATRAGAALSWLGSMFWSYAPDIMWAWSTPASVPSAEEREAILEGVLGSRKVISVARQMGLSRVERRRQVRDILNTMVAVQKLWVIRVMAYIMKKLWGYLYPFGIHVKEEEIEMLSSFAGRAPFVIVPTHKSHVDYLLFTYLCFARALPIPHVVAGINLNILFVGPILRWGGAFFIRRSFAGDLLYHAVFDAYVTQLLVAGETVECFIEGGRSRSGKVLPPKSGFLKVVLDAVADGELEDALIVPVSLNYDRIVENDSHIKELSGSEKNAERLLGFLSASFTLLSRILSGKLCLGSVDIGIARPISVRSFLVRSASKIRTKAMASLSNIEILDELDLPVADIVGRAVLLDRENDLSGGDLSGGDLSGDRDGLSEEEESSSDVAEYDDWDGGEVGGGVDGDGGDGVDGEKSEAGPSALGVVEKGGEKGKEKGRKEGVSPMVSKEFLFSKRSSESEAGAGVMDNAKAMFKTLSAHQRKRITFSLGYATLYACNKSSVVLPAALVGTVLLTHYTRGMRYSDLVAKVKWLRNEVNARGGRVESRDGASLSKSITAVLDRVLQRGGRNKGLVKLHKDIVMLSLYSPQERMELSLYRNQLIHNFVPEALVVCSMYANEKAAGGLVAVERKDLLDMARFLSSLLKREFIFKPSPGTGHNFHEIIENLTSRGILAITKQGTVTVNDWGGASGSGYDGGARSDDGSRTSSAGDGSGAVMEASGGTSMYLFLCSLLWPFIDSYWLTALALFHLFPDRNVASKDVINYTQKLGERLYFEGQIDLYEAVSKETVGNALKLFMEKGVIEPVHVENQFTTSPIVRLTREYQSVDALRVFIYKVGAYKKRSRMYRSRRFKAVDVTDIDDAVRIVCKHEGLDL